MIQSSTAAGFWQKYKNKINSVFECIKKFCPANCRIQSCHFDSKIKSTFEETNEFIIISLGWHRIVLVYETLIFGKELAKSQVFIQGFRLLPPSVQREQQSEQLSVGKLFDFVEAVFSDVSTIFQQFYSRWEIWPAPEFGIEIMKIAWEALISADTCRAFFCVFNWKATP